MGSLRLDAGGDGDVRDGVSSSSSTLPHLLRSLTGLLRGMVLEEEEDCDMVLEEEDIDRDMVLEEEEDIDHDMVLEEENNDHVEE